MRIKQDQRAVSNVIVFVLGLVIIVVIVSNVFLWNYEMNQLDWEKMQEDINIANVARVTHSSWFAAQSEYTVNTGSHISGNYTDTQAVDDSYETFRESIQEKLHPNADGQYAQWGTEYPSPPHWDCCDEDPADDDASYVQTIAAATKMEAHNLENHTGSGSINWVRVYVRAKLSSAGTNHIRTLIRTHDSDYESSDTALTTSYQDNYTQYDVNPSTGLAWTWDEMDSLQAGASAEKSGTINVRMTAVWVVVNFTPTGGYKLDMNGPFTIDVSTYPLAYIHTVEIQLRYRANETGENWYLKAYNWTSSTYNDSGFNSTAGHTPTTGWDYYAVNLTDRRDSYVQNNGTIYVKVVDEGPDTNQTTIDIDFLGVRAAINGTRFTFKNEGSLTSHLVSLWIINSTNHQRHDIDLLINSAQTLTYTRADISLPSEEYIVKVVTERGNIASYPGS